ncbi:MAG TPA: hypothetical protein VJ840_07740 [Gemmatimonadaceae bacterium]|nr:hypothetical protein [Gemmatimonadaceae bacterium]
MSPTLRLLVVTASLCALPKARPADAQPVTLRSGVVIDTVHAVSDTSQTYALYVPSAYDKSRRWPVLLLMDPRGRALVPMRLFRSAAERHGFIVMSSYQTQSDGPVEPNDRAMNAMLADAVSRFSVDARRFYFGGFSGTGRIAWNYAYSIPENVAGVIEVGAGLPAPDLLLQKKVAQTPTPFVVFLGVGSTDFNYAEVLALNSKLDAFGIRHHLTTFDGPHAWPPESVCAEAVTWLQLQAMRDGRLAANQSWIDSVFTAARLAIDSVALIDPYSAALLYRQTAADYAGLHKTDAIEAAAVRLAESDLSKRSAKRIARLADDEQEFEKREEKFLSDFARNDKPPTISQLRSELDLDDVQQRASRTTDRLDAVSAQRLLASILVRASFYEPRRYLAAGDTLKALTMFALAQSIQPENTQLCAERDRIYRLFASRKSVARELACETK